MSTSIIIDHKKLAKQLAKVGHIAKKNEWFIAYDKQLDNLYYSPKKIKDGFILYAINKEYSIYIDKKSNLGGLFVEYYQANLATHEKKYREFKNIFSEKLDGLRTIPEYNSVKAEELQEVLKAEVLSELVLKEDKKVTLAI